MPTPETAKIDTLIRWRDVAALTGFGRRYLSRLANEGKFPRPLKFETGAVRFSRLEIESWIEDRKSARGA